MISFDLMMCLNGYLSIGSNHQLIGLVNPGMPDRNPRLHAWRSTARRYKLSRSQLTAPAGFRTFSLGIYSQASLNHRANITKPAKAG